MWRHLILASEATADLWSLLLVLSVLELKINTSLTLPFIPVFCASSVEFILWFVHHILLPLWLPPDLGCPPNSSYSLCVSSCPETCLGVVGPPGCDDVCVEGCKCNPGFILSNDMCVSLKDCGCMDPSGIYHPVSGKKPHPFQNLSNVVYMKSDVSITFFVIVYIITLCVCQVGDNWYLEGCKQECMCHSGGLIQCHNTSCEPTTESCQLHDGEYECRPLG